MAIPATTTTTMSQQQEQDESNNYKDDHHEQDMVMPGFRFHPTEEELIEFYLRRKVEGKRFNVELITFLDLYRYDPWELPALAAIGEKEWFFYVPRDKKYRNGDRPNRVTTSGYWKATGADRMIRTESFRSIGLKKTLVFYSGKAPKGIRTSWIMNEYRLPHHETERLQEAEISLCRVYKRAGVEDHPSLPRSLPARASSSSSSSRAALKRKINDDPSQEAMEEFQAYNNATNQPHNKQVMSDQTSGSSTDNVATSLGLITNHHNTNYNINPNLSQIPLLPPHSSDHHSSLEINDTKILQQLAPNCNQKTMFNPSPSFSSSSHVIDDLHRLLNFQNPSSINHHHHQQQQHYQVNPDHSSLLPPMQPEPPPPQTQQQHPLSLNMMLPGSLQSAFSDRLWDWSSVTDPSKDFDNPFK